MGEKDCFDYKWYELFCCHVDSVVIGKIYFLLVRIKLKNMDLEIRRRESTGSGANTHVATETLAKFEFMDGAPVRENNKNTKQQTAKEKIVINKHADCAGLPTLVGLPLVIVFFLATITFVVFKRQVTLLAPVMS
ncbi:vacuolar protein sorting-associated protein 26A [Tanacetum coccineum]